MSINSASWTDILAFLARQAGEADARAEWPDASWDALRRAEILSWCVPAAYGGREPHGDDLLSGYEQLAGACLTSCFILSQRNAACRRLVDSGRDALCRELLPALARGETFATVGLSQLTTSRQHRGPALCARQQGDVYILDGVMPWVTGAPRADHFVTGAVLEDGQQILAVLPARLPGVEVGAPLELMALRGSLTSEVRCAGVVLERRWLLAGPAAKVMGTARGGAGGLDTSCLALGLAGAATDYLLQEAGSRAELQPTAERLDRSRRSLRDDLHRLAEAPGAADPTATVTLRARANSLVLRATQAALTASKGTGFLLDHPAQRWARQALFFLVWSCPRPAADAMLAYLADDACPTL